MEPGLLKMNETEEKMKTVVDYDFNFLTSKEGTPTDFEVKVEKAVAYGDSKVKEHAEKERRSDDEPAVCSERTASSKRSVLHHFEQPLKKTKVAKPKECFFSESRAGTEDEEFSGEIEMEVENDSERGSSNGQEVEWGVRTVPCELLGQNIDVESSQHEFTKKEPKPLEVAHVEVIKQHTEEQESNALPLLIPGSYSLPQRKSTSNLNSKTRKKLGHRIDGERNSLLERYRYEELTTNISDFKHISPCEASKMSLKLLFGFLEWVASQRSQQTKLQGYQLRLEMAERARTSGMAGFTPDDAWFINLKNQLPKNLFVEHQETFLHYDKAINRLDGESSGSLNYQKTILFRNLAEWYHRNSSTLVVSPGQLEREAYRLAQRMGLERFYLSKNDVLSFVNQQGLYCDINGKISRFMRVKDGILRLLFDAKFEVWYYEWHKSTDDMLRCAISEINCVDRKGWSMFKAYLAILAEFVAEGAHLKSLAGVDCCQSEAVSLAVIESLCTQSVFGYKRAVCLKARKVFSSKLSEEISIIKSFNSAFAKKYCYRAYTFCSDHLKKNAKELAVNMGMSLTEIDIRKNWLLRFAELSVVCSLTDSTQHGHPKDLGNYFHSSAEDFSTALERWYEHGCPKDVAPYSSIASGNVEPYDPSAKACPSKQKLETSHLTEVDSWYKEHILRSYVKSYELLEKSEEIAYFMDMPTFVADESWMKSFVWRNGLRYFDEQDGLITISSLPNPIKRKSFLELFEAWYSEGNCPKCSKRVVYLASSNPDSETEAPNIKSSTLDSAVHDWYIEVRFLVRPGILEKKAAEIAKQFPNKTFTRSKKWAEDFIEQYGLYCVMSGDRHLFFKSSFEFLRCTFLCEFEIWYHQWPLNSKHSLLSETVKNSNFDWYKRTLLDWYLKVSQIGKIPCQKIVTKSMAMIDKMPGVTPEDVEVWTKRWCRQCNDVVRRIRGFDYAMRMWYFERKKSGVFPYPELVAEAEKCAQNMKLTNFVANDVWSKRFVERYGIYSYCETVPKFLSSVDILEYDLDKLFSAWSNLTDGPEET